jgi:photosystem II stability/assembly factor-like uncharacterized protein
MKDVTIVVGTVGQSIMRSEDNGQTWARVGPRRRYALLVKLVQEAAFLQSVEEA